MTLKGVTDDEKTRLAGLGLVAVRQGELFRRVKEGTLDPDWVAGELQRLIQGKLGDALDQVAEWGELYKDLGVQIDFSELRIPTKEPGFDRLIMVAKEVMPQWIYNKCAGLFVCWKWTDDDLDKVVRSERTAKDSPYAVWFRDRVEADEELKNLSANNLNTKGIPGITLEERLLMELKYFKETGNHLDIVNWTLCAGSRCADGGVPSVDWIPAGRGLRVRWFAPGDAPSSLRSRRAVV